MRHCAAPFQSSSTRKNYHRYYRYSTSVVSKGSSWWFGLSSSRPYSGLVPPTDQDASELFHRMNSRPGSIITDETAGGGTGDAGGRLAKYNHDWTKQYQGQSSIVVRPASTKEVSQVLSYCNERHLGVVPQGGNTGLVGGSVGIPPNREIILSLESMNQIHGLDPFHGILKAQAGCILQNLQDYVAQQDHLVPVDLGSKGTCQIGGNLSTNAGGSYYYRYGSLHANTMGLEVVVPDGTILNLGYDPCHLKDNTGYDMKHLFIGAEGTLGVITNVALLCPRLPLSKGAAFLACSSYEDVCQVMTMAKSRLGEILAALEFMDQSILKLVLESSSPHYSLDSTGSSTFPLSEIPKYAVLIETHGSNEVHDYEKLQDLVETAFVDGFVKDGSIAQNWNQIQDFWKIRELCNPSVAKQGYVYKYDVSLAVTDFEDFIQEMQTNLRTLSPQALCTNWGHVIDGNLHLNIVVPGQKDKDPELYVRLEELVLHGIIARGGSISAEHGLGQYKNKHLTRIKDPATLQTMRRIKTLFDPHGIMNPGKYLPLDG